MSLKFAAVGNLMVLVVLEESIRRKDRSAALWPVESYDPLLAMIGRGTRAAEAASPQATERAASEARR